MLAGIWIMLKKTINIKLIKKLIGACFEVKPIAKERAMRLLPKSKSERYDIKNENGEIGARGNKVSGGISIKLDIKNQPKRQEKYFA